MSATLEEVIEQVRTLPPEEQRQLRELTASFGDLLLIAVLYAAFNKLEKVDAGELGRLLENFNRELRKSRGPATPTSEGEKAIYAGQIRGKYRDVLSSSEDFIARKAIETAREDRRR